MRGWGLAAASVVLVAATACGPASEGVVVASRAVAQGARAVGRTADREVVASAGSLKAISSQSGASEETVRSMAANLDQQTVWQRSVARTRSVYASVPGEVRDPVINLACQGFTGQIRTREQLASAITSEFRGQLTRDQLLALEQSVEALWSELNQAAASSDRGKAAALLTCFTLDQVTS